MRPAPADARRVALRHGGWPGACEVCRRFGPTPLCDDCVQRFAPACTRCPRCALPLPAGGPACLRCLNEAPPFERTFCAVDYGFPWDRLIARLKFGAQPELASTLADLLLARLDGVLPGAFVAVPLSDTRLAERGYDQAWELARRLGRRCGVPAHARVLERRFDSRPQSALSRRERAANLRGAFRARAAAGRLVQGAHLALVDDVMTTGATAAEAASALRAAGAARVDLWVVARTPAPPDD